ncbi:unnamed protein product, partial [Staurois parvus]
MGRFPAVVCVSAPPTMGRFPAVVCVSAPPTMGRFPAVVCVSAPPTMGRSPWFVSLLAICHGRRGLGIPVDSSPHIQVKSIFRVLSIFCTSLYGFQMTNDLLCVSSGRLAAEELG